MRQCDYVEESQAVTSQQFHENELEKMRQNQTLSVPAKLQIHLSKGKMIFIIERMSTESDITYMLSLDDQTRTKKIAHFDGWFGNSGGRPRARIVPGPYIHSGEELLHTLSLDLDSVRKTCAFLHIHKIHAQEEQSSVFW